MMGAGVAGMARPERLLAVLVQSIWMVMVDISTLEA
jgi:hypothetical protein